MTKVRRVDLFTTDRDFDSIILAEYPGLIFENQHKVDISDRDQKEYGFLDLNFKDLFRFLPKYRGRYEFEVRDKKGDIIEINKIKKNKTGNLFGC